MAGGAEEPEPEPEPRSRRAGAGGAASRARPRRPPARPARSAARAKAEPQAKPDDEEAARLVALDMALAGTPRDETEQYLAEHYTLADPGAILDDVYALAGS